MKLFDLGEILITKSIKSILEKEPMLDVTLSIILEAYQTGDWGIICDEDKQ